MEKEFDIIEVTLPFKAEYVSIVRLTASGVANRLGFDIETVEDIKVAISEVCNKLINVGSKTAGSYNIAFQLDSTKLKIIFKCEDESLRCLFGEEDQGLGVALINALMDEVELCTCNDYILSMSKNI